MQISLHPELIQSDQAFEGEPVLSSPVFWGRSLLVVIVLVWAASFVIGFQTALSVLSVISLAAAIAGLRNPALGLFGIGMICTLDAIMAPLLLSGGLLRWNTLNYWLLIVMALNLRFLLRLSDLHSRFLQLFLLLLALEIAFSSNRQLGILVVLGVIVQFGILVYFVRANEDERNWYWLGLVCGTLAAVGGLAFFIQKSHLPYINENDWSFFPLTALFATCLALPHSTRQRLGWIYLMALAAVNVGWIFLSGSRGDLAMALCCGLFMVLMLRGVSSKIVVVLVVVLVGLLISTQFADLQDRTVQRITILFNSESSDRARTSGRSDLVYGGWLIFLDHRLGVGTGGYPDAWAQLPYQEGMSHFRTGRPFPAHAGWIKTLAENGVPGVVLLCGYVVSFLVVGWLRPSRDLRLFGVLMTTMLGIAFVSFELQWAKGVWFLAAGVTTLLNRESLQKHLRDGKFRTRILDIIRPERSAR